MSEAAQILPTTLQYERTFKASRERVFDAWTQNMGAWLGPPVMKCADFKFDAKVGGEYLCAMKSPAGDVHTVAGVVQTLERPERLVLTWAWVTDGERGHESIVDVQLIAKGDETVMKFEHRGLETEESAKHHNEGWTSSWEKLAASLA
jgi:uncharacterized protein YndB with AHSA1/START domain